MHPQYEYARGDRAMSMENVQLVEFVDRFPVREYRISGEKIEARILVGGPEQKKETGG
jgi:hypothetical protein